MLNRETVSLELYKFSVIYGIDAGIIKNEKDEIKKWEYLEFLFDDLIQEGFNDNDFLVAIRTIKRQNPNMYGKMPNLAMFIENKPATIYQPPERIIYQAPKIIEKQYTAQEKKEMQERTEKVLKELNLKAEADKKERDKERKALLDWNKQHILEREEKIKREGGALSPQMKKIQEQVKATKELK